jgi:hypothetical protein
MKPPPHNVSTNLIICCFKQMTFGLRRARTQVVAHTHDPEWDDAFTILVADRTSEVCNLYDAAYL